MVICLTKYLLGGDKHKLSKIWLAAHWEKKIKRTQIFDVDIERSIQDIMEAEIILDLRISGHLLVGVVKIHSRKSKYLLTECSSIFYQIKLFRSGNIDLPVDKQTAPLNEITLDGFFDNPNIENDVIDAIFTNQSRIEDITLKETNEMLSLLDDGDMVDFAFHEGDEPFENFEDSLILLNESLDNPEDLSAIMKEREISVSKRTKNPSCLNIADGGKTVALDICNDKEFDLDILNSQASEFEIPETIEVPVSISDDSIHSQLDTAVTSSSQVKRKIDDKLILESFEISTKSISIKRMKGSLKLRKRKLCIDHITCMSHQVIKKHILDTSDITSEPHLAPASKRLMNLKEFGSAEKLFCLPVINLNNLKFLKLYQRNLKTHQSDSFESLSEDEEFHARKKSRSDSLHVIAVNESLSENFDATPVSCRRNSTHMDVDIDMPILDNSMIDAELGSEAHDPIPETDNIPHLSLFEHEFNNSEFPANDVTDIQSTQISKTSEERCQHAFQNKITELLHCLKLLFQEKPVICFSSLTQNCTRRQVSQKFFCLLMLKKFEVLCLEQPGAYNEVFISPDLNFDSACQKFCGS